MDDRLNFISGKETFIKNYVETNFGIYMYNLRDGGVKLGETDTENVS